jgi:cold shock CspA family protein
MRYQGRVAEWKGDRGFGFITPNGGGARVFLHISALFDRGPRPSVGALVTYEIVSATDGRVRAQDVRFVGTPSGGRARGLSPLLLTLAFGALLVAAAYVAWVRLSHPNSTVAASAYKILFVREALRSNPLFQCAPAKSSCSAMTSCAEAFFHQEKCGVSNMDGDRDGIPCEHQWCN